MFGMLNRGSQGGRMGQQLFGAPGTTQFRPQEPQQPQQQQTQLPFVGALSGKSMMPAPGIDPFQRQTQTQGSPMQMGMGSFPMFGSNAFRPGRRRHMGSQWLEALRSRYPMGFGG